MPTSPRSTGTGVAKATRPPRARPATKTKRAPSGAKTKRSASATKPKSRTTGAKERLAPYRARRDFARTPEPQGRAAPAHAHEFVVQKHDATRLHYDFRLEHGGVLWSWAVPKGPSMRPGIRRLAVRTEDHPREYASFEGVIPKGEYGAGSVIVWDRGPFTTEGDAAAALAKGHLVFTLHGEKLRGRFHLVRTHSEEGKQHEQWLLFKAKDAAADPDSDVVSEHPESVLTGRTVEEVASAPTRVWHSHRVAKRARRGIRGPAERAEVARTQGAPAHALTEETRSGAADDADVAGVVARLRLPFKLTNLAKVLYPEARIRKADVIAYFAAIASFALPHLADRPLTLVRCPNGWDENCFFQKHAVASVPASVARVPIREHDAPGSAVGRYMTVHDFEGIVALAQMGALELHTWPCHVRTLERPDQLVFDLDPDVGVAWDTVVEAALLVRARLRALELESFVKTTGGKGLHVVVPLTRTLGWTEHYAFARAFAESIVRAKPDRYVTNMRKAVRKGKIFVDYMRNGRGATAIAPYSTRAREGATVATPIAWTELEEGIDPKTFDLYSVVHRTSGAFVDPWRAYATTRQTVRAADLRKLGVRD